MTPLRAYAYNQENKKDLALRKEFQSLLAKKQLRMIFQPIINFKKEGILGFEGLSRGPIKSKFHSPLQLFKYAETFGSLYKLEKVTRELAFESSRSLLRNGEKLFINLSPQVIYDPDFTPGHTISLLNQYNLSPSNIVFEITERSAIEDFSAFTRVLHHYRDQGFEIAVDDAGAGYSSLQAISEIQPDYIKVDRSLISDIHENSVKKHILDAFVTFAKKMDSIIIAEGIEKQEELEAVIDLGIDFGQGYYIAMPKNPVEVIDKKKWENIRLTYGQSNEKNKFHTHIAQLTDEIVIMDRNQVVKKLFIKDLL